jgi:L-serine dehydratase
VSEVVRRNELAHTSAAALEQGLDRIWRTMCQSIDNGLGHVGQLPGELGVRRRAPNLHRQLRKAGGRLDGIAQLDWLNLYAIAVAEENAAGGRIVTAPTNGAAGVVPAVLAYLTRFGPGGGDGLARRFLLSAGAIGMLIKRNASISGAEVGCQGEVGSACAMAAGAACEALGGSPAQVENAAEIGLEHNLGLTCDPVGGLVQIPCIERNAVAAVAALNAARIALRGDGRHMVSLDTAIKTMRQTGRDMSLKYKETSLGGLAVNVTEC